MIQQHIIKNKGILSSLLLVTRNGICDKISAKGLLLLTTIEGPQSVHSIVVPYQKEQNMM